MAVGSQTQECKAKFKFDFTIAQYIFICQLKYIYHRYTTIYVVFIYVKETYTETHYF